MIDIIDIGSGNIRSLRNSFTELEINSQQVSSPDALTSNIVVLPGVGSAGHYMSRLRELKLDKALTDHVQNGGRLIGICLGFQLLTRFSEEDGGVNCLGLLDAETKKLSGLEFENSSHTGWEEFEFRSEFLKKGEACAQLGLTRKRTLKGRVFFNHEYGVLSGESRMATQVISNPNLTEFTAMVVHKNIIGMQFHPEKSQSTGFSLLSMIL